MANQDEKLNAGGFINQIMISSEYKEFMKNLIAEVVDEKITQRLEKCESDLHLLAGRVDKLESVNKEKDDTVIDVKNLERQLNDLQQYSRRNSLRVSGIPEEANESTDEIIKQLAEEKLGERVKS